MWRPAGPFEFHIKFEWEDEPGDQTMVVFSETKDEAAVRREVDRSLGSAGEAYTIKSVVLFKEWTEEEMNAPATARPSVPDND